MGLLIDRIGSKKTTFINVALLTGTTILSLVVIYQVNYNYITFICCFFWGLSDGALNIHSFQVLGSEFESTDLPFICLCLMQGIGCFGMQLFQTYYLNPKNQHELYGYTVVSSLIGLVGCSLTYFFPFKKPLSTRDNSEERQSLIQHSIQETNHTDL
jgi:MFS family permease